MKIKNRIKRLRARQQQYDTMLEKADSMERLVLEKSTTRPGSTKK